ncbi:MAG: serine hydrolase domain-containing protein [Bdellovibrionia bacterium]
MIVFFKFLIFLTFLITVESPIYAAHLPSALEGYFQNQSLLFPKEQILVGWIDSDGSQYQTFGNSPIQDQAAPLERLYEIGSLTKLFTTLSFTLLVEQGQLGWNDPVELFLPELRDTPAGQIRLIQLATHSSGLPRDPFDPWNLTDLLRTQSIRSGYPYSNCTHEQLIHFLKRVHLNQGLMAFQYSNVGISLLERVLTQVSGQGFETLITQQITEPLGMAGTTVRIPLAQTGSLLQGHHLFGFPVPPFELKALVGAGGLRSTMRDLLLFAQAQLRPPQTPLGNAMALTQNFTFSSLGADLKLGWMLQNSSRGNPIFWHHGLTDGFSSFLMIYPADQKALIVLRNRAVLSPMEIPFFLNLMQAQ